MRAAVVIALALVLLVTLSQVAEAKIRPGTATRNSSYASANPFLRAPNYTLDIDKTPADLRNPAQVTIPRQVQRDILLPGIAPERFDPRACAGQVATCYQVLSHNATYYPSQRGTNRTNLGSYAFPFRRARMYTCIADDLECVQESRACWCPSGNPLAEEPLPQSSACSDDAHLCQSAPGFLTKCEGNLTACRERYGQCSCGMHGTCTASGSNACSNTRNEIVTCEAAFADCVEKYGTCSCGMAAITAYPPACAASRHACSLGGATFTCSGPFQSCALQYDRCECGVA